MRDAQPSGEVAELVVVLSTMSCRLPLPDAARTQNDTVYCWLRSKMPGGDDVVVDCTPGCVLPIEKRAPARPRLPSLIAMPLAPPSAKYISTAGCAGSAR